jgi:hypothetical protein
VLSKARRAPARRADGTLRTVWFAGLTDGSPKVHQSLVELPGGVFPGRHDVFGQGQQPALGGGAVIRWQSEHSSKDPINVSVDCGSPFFVSKVGHRRGGVFTHARQALEGFSRVGDYASMFPDHRFGQRMKVGRAPVVSQTRPGGTHAARSRAGQNLKGGKPFEESVVKQLDPGNLGLLQHELRNYDRIRITGFSPRKLASPPSKPGEQSSFEREGVGGRGFGHNRYATYVMRDGVGTR